MDDPDWTAIVDALFDRFEAGASAEVVAAEISVSAGTVRRWRRLRQKGKSIPEPRGDSRAALLLVRDGHRHPRAPRVGGATAAGRAGETWPDYLTEVLVREARAAEKRADAALSWARWLEKESDGRAASREDIERLRREAYDRAHPPTIAPVAPAPTPEERAAMEAGEKAGRA